MFILQKTERACAELIASSSLSASADFTVYCGIDSEGKTAPALIITAESATEEFPNSGVWHVKTEFKVKEIAADSNVTSSLASRIFEVFMDGNAQSVLSNYPGYKCYDLFTEDTTNTQDGDAWIQTVRYDIVGVLT